MQESIKCSLCGLVKLKAMEFTQEQSLRINVQEKKRKPKSIPGGAAFKAQE